MLPAKKSKKWVLVSSIYFIIIFISLLATRIILGNFELNRGILGMFLLALISTIPAFISGYLDKRLFFYIYSLSLIVGIVYAFYVVIADVAPGWGDLTSMIGYMFMVVTGMVIAFFAETIYHLLHPSRRT